MKRFFCDRCDVETTNKRTIAIDVVDHPDEDGNGSVSLHADLCVPCGEQAKQWIQRGTGMAARGRR
jgi:hypothetical protein